VSTGKFLSQYYDTVYRLPSTFVHRFYCLLYLSTDFRADILHLHLISTKYIMTQYCVTVSIHFLLTATRTYTYFVSGKNKTAYRITVRQLESLIRLAEALARVHLNEFVSDLLQCMKYFRSVLGEQRVYRARRVFEGPCSVNTYPMTTVAFVLLDRSNLIARTHCICNFFLRRCRYGVDLPKQFPFSHTLTLSRWNLCTSVRRTACCRRASSSWRPRTLSWRTMRR